MKKLKYNDLKPTIDYDIKQIENSIDIKEEHNMLGQDNAIASLSLGINTDDKRYNIYVSGDRGLGQERYIEDYVKEVAKTKTKVDDLIYVYNFEDARKPKAIFLKAGLGKELKKELEEFIHLVKIYFPKVFSSKEFETEKEEIIKKHNKEKDSILNIVKEKALERGYGLKNSSGGIYFMPINDDLIMSDDEFEALQESEKDIINEEIEKLQDDISPIVKDIKEIDKNIKKDIENLYYNTILLYIGHHLSPIFNKYIDNEKVMLYLKDLKEDLIESILNIALSDEEENNFLFSSNTKKSDENIFGKYCVNLIVDNSDTLGAPVIIDYSPTYTNLVGEVEFENELGNFSSDYMKIKGGLIHKANGGFLILRIDDILKNPYCIETILKIIRNRKLNIEPLREYQVGSVPLATINPEPIDVYVKFILIGSSYYYDFLSNCEEDFSKYFGVHSIFEDSLDIKESSIKDFLGYIRNFEDSKNTLKLDTLAIKKMLEYSSRLSGSQRKISTRIDEIEKLIIEANAIALEDKKDIISDIEIEKALDRRKTLLNSYEKRYEEMILNNEILIDTKGEKVGSINGLSVLDYGDICFGKPIKITATSYIGKQGIINVEKEAEMSGSIYDKGVEVISGYIGHMYGDLLPLCLSCRLCFEQNYSGIDGDSASGAELFSVISSLSGLAIRQDLAVTGSVNQFGDIQPIGAVNDKIEGFFDICYKRGLTGKQGVIIPIQNIADLCLKKEVIESVKNDSFHIYAISNIDEGLELLMGYKAGKKDAKGYEKDTIHYKVMKKLEHFYSFYKR